MNPCPQCNSETTALGSIFGTGTPPEPIHGSMRFRCGSCGHVWDVGDPVELITDGPVIRWSDGDVEHEHFGQAHSHRVQGRVGDHAHPASAYRRRIPSMVAGKREDPIGTATKPVERAAIALALSSLERLDLKPGEILAVHLPPKDGGYDWSAEVIRMLQDIFDAHLADAGLPNRSLVLFPGVRLEAISPDVVCAVCGNAPRYHPPRAPGQRGAVMDHRFVLARPEDVPHAVEDPRGAPPGLRPDACAQCGAPERLHGQPSRAFGEYLLDHPFVP